MRIKNVYRKRDSGAGSSRRLLSASVICIALLSLCRASTEESGGVTKPNDSTKSTRIVLGSDAGEPGMSVTIPIYFSPAEGAKFEHLKVEIKFVSRNLKFAKFEDGIAAETGNLKIQTELRDEKDEQGLEYSILKVEASQPKDAPAKAIPSGLLGYITFQINKEGRAADISLRVSADGTELVTGKPIKTISASDGKVRVAAPGSIPLVSCFFFSH